MRLHSTLFHTSALISIASAQRTSPIPSTQNPEGPEFDGNPALINPLSPKVILDPLTSQGHQDTGNTGSLDFPSPLGSDTQVTSALQLPGLFLWGSDGTLTGARNPTVEFTSPISGLAAYDPDTIEVLAEWFPMKNESLNIGYIQLRLEDNSIVLSSTGGHIFVVQREDSYNGTTLTLVRQVDVQEYLDGNPLLATQFDARGNIWFATGSYLGDAESFTVGFITLEDAVYTYHAQGQDNRNGITTNGTEMYIVSGPPMDDPSGEPGYMWKFVAGEDNASINIDWQVPYETGSVSPGSGTTPSILGSEFVTVVDNAEGRVNLLVYHREVQENSADQLHCAVPLFGFNAGAAEIRATTHFDGTNYTVAVANTFGGILPRPVMLNDSDINGSWNNLTVMPGGITQVSLNLEGCHVAWENESRTRSIPILSTNTGILYFYTQDVDLSFEGLWVWYVVAIDWRSGKLLWRKRAGAGGSYNDNYMASSISPNGRFYQITTVGTVWVEDGA